MSNAAKLRKKAVEFEQQKQFDKAIASYLRAIEAADAEGGEFDVGVFNKVGDLMLRQGRVAEAVTHYERAVEHYAAQSLHNNAIALCNKILRHAPGRTGVYLTLGRICARKGLRGDATRNFLEYAQRMQQDGQLVAAMQSLAEVAELFPELEEVRAHVAEHAERAGIELPSRGAADREEPTAITGGSAGGLVFLDVDYDAPLADVLAADGVVPGPEGGERTGAPVGNGAPPAAVAPPGPTSELSDIIIFDPLEVQDAPAPLAGLEETRLDDPFVPVDDVEPLAGLPEAPERTLEHVERDPGLVTPLGMPIVVDEAEAVAAATTLDGLVGEDEERGLLLLPSDDQRSSDAVELAEPADADAAARAGDMSSETTGERDETAVEADADAADADAEDADAEVADVGDGVVGDAYAGDADVGDALADVPAADVESERAAEADALEAAAVATDIPHAAGGTAEDIALTDVSPTDIDEHEVGAIGADDALVDDALVDDALVDDAPSDDATSEVALADADAGSVAAADAPSTELPWLVERMAEDGDGAFEHDVGAIGDVTDDVTDDGAERAAPPVEAADGWYGAVGDGETRDVGAGETRAGPAGADALPWLDLDESSVDAAGAADAVDAVDAEADAVDAEADAATADAALPWIASVEDVAETDVESGSAVVDDPLAAAMLDLDEPVTSDDPVPGAVGEAPEDGAIFGAADVPADGVVDPVADASEHAERVAPLPSPARENAHDLVLPGPLPLLQLPALRIVERMRERGVVVPTHLLEAIAAHEPSADRDRLLATGAAGAASGGDATEGAPVDADPHGEPHAVDTAGDQARTTVAVDANDIALVAATDHPADDAARSVEDGTEVSGTADAAETADTAGLDAAESAESAESADTVATADTAAAERAADTAAADAALDARLTPIAGMAVGELAQLRCQRMRDEVAEHPRDWARRRRLAEALLETGDVAGGVRELATARDGLAGEGRLEEAARVADEMVRVAPQDILAHQQRVMLAVRIDDRRRLQEGYLDLADALLRLGEEAKAHAVYVRVLELDPWDERARAALGDAAPPPPPRPRPARPADDGYVNLTSWLADAGSPKSTRLTVAEPVQTGDEDADFRQLLDQFREGVAESLGDEEHDAHYDLGVAFKEMGLLDDAIAAFQKALRGRTHRLAAYEALGQCFLEQGSHPVAVTVLSRALHEPGLDDAQRIGVLYLLGYACEALERWDEARGYFERVYATDINFRDVGDRLANLERVTR